MESEVGNLWLLRVAEVKNEVSGRSRIVDEACNHVLMPPA